MNLIDARERAKTYGGVVVKAPVITTVASGRGLARAARSYQSWVLCEKRMHSADVAGVYHREADLIRAHQHARMKGSLIGLGILVIGIVAFWWLTPAWVQALVIIAIWTYLVHKGWARAELIKPRSQPGLLGITQTQLTAAFLAAGVIKKEHALAVVQVPHRDGRGVSMTLDLPPGITAAAAIAARERLASSLMLNANGLVLSGAHGESGHAGRLNLWGTPGDPFAAGSGAHPLLGEQRHNAWRGADFGVDARGRAIRLRLIGSHMLIGAAPNAGKSYAGRCAAAPFLLDRGVRIYIADGKGSDTWAAAAPAAAAYISGDQDEDAAALSRMLDRIITEVRHRNANKIEGTNLTETRSRDAADPVPLLLVIIDELQEYTGNTTPDPDSNERKPPTLGQTISKKLMKLGKLARSAGVILMLLTQRPDDDALPKGLRAVLLTRFALRTRDRWNSDMILGPDFASRGYCTASDNGQELRKGVGILVPDNGEDPDAPEGYPMLRTYEVGDDDWSALCRRAAALRAHQDPGDDLGGGGEGPEPEPNPEPVVDDVEEQDAQVVFLRDYILGNPSSGFRPSHELCRALGINPKELAEMMRDLGVQNRVRDHYDPVANRKRQVRGYDDADILDRTLPDAA